MSNRTEALAARLEAGATALAAFAATLSESEWQTRLPKDGRKIGAVVHHVASVYPIEIHLAQELAAGRPITAVTWDAVHAMNRAHAEENDGVTKETALALLASNSAAAAAGSVLSAMKIWIALRPCRSIAMRRSPASSCWRITQCATVTTTSPGPGPRSPVRRVALTTRVVAASQSRPVSAATGHPLAMHCRRNAVHPCAVALGHTALENFANGRKPALSETTHAGYRGLGRTGAPSYLAQIAPL